jgi:hypothetical protein
VILCDLHKCFLILFLLQSFYSFSIIRYKVQVIDNTLFDRWHVTLFTSVSSLIRNGYSRLRMSKNKRFILGGAISLKLNFPQIMYMTKLHYANLLLFIDY